MTMKKFRFLTSGESHGKCLTAIIEGVPAGLRIKPEVINEDLKKRQAGYGRGARMQIENDVVEIKAGVRLGKTTGAPICIEIKNKDKSEQFIARSHNLVRPFSLINNTTMQRVKVTPQNPIFCNAREIEYCDKISIT